MSDFIKNIELKDCSINTLISYLPKIVNDNNKEIKRVFADIFEFGDSTNNAQYIKTSINTKGTIKGNTGQFNNLYISHLSLDSSSLSNDFIDAKIKHQNCPDRFKLNVNSNDADASTKLDTINSFAHDADNIFFDYQYGSSSIIKNISVKECINSLTNEVSKIVDDTNKNDTKINSLDASIKELYSMLESIVSKLNIEKEVDTTSINENDNLVEVYNNPSKSYTYSAENYK